MKTLYITLLIILSLLTSMGGIRALKEQYRQCKLLLNNVLKSNNTLLFIVYYLQCNKAVSNLTLAYNSVSLTYNTPPPIIEQTLNSSLTEVKE